MDVKENEDVNVGENVRGKPGIYVYLDEDQDKPINDEISMVI